MKETILKAIEAALNSNPQNFKHSEVRKIKRGLMECVKQIREDQKFAALAAERNTVNEF